MALSDSEYGMLQKDNDERFLIPKGVKPNHITSVVFLCATSISFPHQYESEFVTL